MARDCAILWFIWSFFHRVTTDTAKSTFEPRPINPPINIVNINIPNLDIDIFGPSPAPQQQVFQDGSGQTIATVTFARVTNGGATTVTPLASGSPGFVPLPPTYSLGSPPTYYEGGVSDTWRIYFAHERTCRKTTKSLYIFIIPPTIKSVFDYRRIVNINIPNLDIDIFGPSPAPQQQVFQDGSGQTIATVTFARVTNGGATTVTPLASGSPGFVPLPPTYSLGSPPTYYEGGVSDTWRIYFAHERTCRKTTKSLYIFIIPPTIKSVFDYRRIVNINIPNLDIDIFFLHVSRIVPSSCGKFPKSGSSSFRGGGGGGSGVEG